MKFPIGLFLAILLLLCSPIVMLLIVGEILRDMWISLVALGVTTLVPFIMIMLEADMRRTYPIRVHVAYQIGGEDVNRKTIMVEDRLGHIEVPDAEGKGSGVMEWKLHDIKRPVQRFRLDYIGEKKVFWGLMSSKFANVIAVAGEKGEEFYPMRLDATTQNYVPVWDADKGLMLHTIHQRIETRNKKTSWFKDNMAAIVLGGLVTIIAVLLLLIVFQLKDVSGSLGASIERSSACIETAQGIAPNEAPPTAKTPIAGVPFAFG